VLLQGGAIKETGLSIRRRPPPSSAAKSSAVQSAETTDGAVATGAARVSMEDEGPCQSCGAFDSPSWNKTVVEGMTLCEGCAVMLGGAS
jgi:hypothetical protein